MIVVRKFVVDDVPGLTSRPVYENDGSSCLWGEPLACQTSACRSAYVNNNAGRIVDIHGSWEVRETTT